MYISRKEVNAMNHRATLEIVKNGVENFIQLSDELSDVPLSEGGDTFGDHAEWGSGKGEVYALLLNQANGTLEMVAIPVGLLPRLRVIADVTSRRFEDPEDVEFARKNFR